MITSQAANKQQTKCANADDYERKYNLAVHEKPSQ